MIDNCCDDNPQVIAGLTQFTPSIPKFYWDVDSQEQGIKQLCKTVCMLIDYLNEVADQVNIDTDAIEELKATFQKFQESGFDDYYRAQIEQWVKDNMENIIRDSIKMVFFGLTDDGYFCAYIPESWSDLTFDTGMNYGTYTYGRLMIRMETDGSGVIDNTGYGEYGNPLPYEELKSQVAKLNETVYTALTAKG